MCKSPWLTCGKLIEASYPAAWRKRSCRKHVQQSFCWPSNSALLSKLLLPMVVHQDGDSAWQQEKQRPPPVEKLLNNKKHCWDVVSHLADTTQNYLEPKCPFPATMSHSKAQNTTWRAAGFHTALSCPSEDFAKFPAEAVQWKMRRIRKT